MAQNNINPMSDWGYDRTIAQTEPVNDFTSFYSHVTCAEDSYNKTAPIGEFNGNGNKTFFTEEGNNQEVPIVTPAYGYDSDLQLTYNSDEILENYGSITNGANGNL